MCNKAIIRDLTIPQRRRYATLWNISFWLKAQQQQHTKRARTVKECDRDWRAAASNYDETEIYRSTRQIAHNLRS